jgi:hypothetical protein
MNAVLPICRPGRAWEILGLVTTNMSLLRSLGRFLWALVGYKHVVPLGLKKMIIFWWCYRYADPLGLV